MWFSFGGIHIIIPFKVDIPRGIIGEKNPNNVFFCTRGINSWDWLGTCMTWGPRV